MIDPDMLGAMIQPLELPDDIRFLLMHSTAPAIDGTRWAARIGLQEYFAFGKTAADAVEKAVRRFNDGLENGDYPNGKIPKIRRRG